MQGVPRRTSLITATTPRIFVPESVNNNVPYRPVFRNQDLFGQPNPNWIEYKPSAAKIPNI